MRRITPFLWFDGRAEEAMQFYASIFKHAKIGEVMRRTSAGPGEPSAVLSVSFELDGQAFTALNGGPAFNFTPAISFFVRCESQEEVDYYWDRLLEGGTPARCGWLTDKFGISWQIVPTLLHDLLTGPDSEKSARVMRAMLKMIKLDVNLLREAYEQEN